MGRSGTTERIYILYDKQMLRGIFNIFVAVYYQFPSIRS